MLIVMFEKQNINTVTFFVNWKECFENSLESVSLYQNETGCTLKIFIENGIWM